MAEGFISDFKRFFVRGLAVLVPTLLTVWFIIVVFMFVQNYLGKYMNTTAQWTIVQYRGVMGDESFTLKGGDADWDVVKAYWRTYKLAWIGFVLALGAIYFVGRFITSFVGRSVWHVTERAFFRTPVVRQVYPFVKQVTDFLFTQRRMQFSDVVAVEYPRKGIWSVGLLTGQSMRTLTEKLSSDLVTVFIPSSPTPFTGYTITVRKEEIIELPISIDDALKFTVSGGVIMPPREQLTAAAGDAAGDLPGDSDEQ